jgi:prepilin-type N-terminal cleavage/methylation domain-containing protein
MNVESRTSRVELGAANAAPAPSPFLVSRHPSRVTRQAFTLIEMLVVLSIMGIMAALAVPALKNFGHADAMTAAAQQMVGDVGRARQLAISQRTTVYMVFVPANFLGQHDSGTTGHARHDQHVR